MRAESHSWNSSRLSSAWGVLGAADDDNIGSGRFKAVEPDPAPGVASGALSAFVTSFDEVVIALFIAGSEERTLPRQMWSGVRETPSPTIPAVATLLTLISTLFLATIQWLHRRAERQKLMN